MSGNKDRSEPKDDPLTGDERGESGQKRRLDVSPAQVTGGALASVTAAFLGSQLGSAGTILGAGMTSIVITLGGALYQRSLENAKDKAKVAANKAAVARQRRPSAPTTVLNGAGSPGRPDPATSVADRPGNLGRPPAPDPSTRAGPSAAFETPAGRFARESGHQRDQGEFTAQPTRRAGQPNGMVWPGGEQVVDEEPGRQRSTECFDRGQRKRGDDATAGSGTGTAATSARSAANHGVSSLGRGGGMRKLRWDGTQYVPPESSPGQLAPGSGAPARQDRAQRESRSPRPAEAASPSSASSASSASSGESGAGQPGPRYTGGTAAARQPGTRVEPGDEVAPAPTRRRGLRWTMLVVSSALIFVLGMLVVTGYETLTGKPLSGGDSGTTVGRAFRPQPAPEPEVPDGGTETTAPTTESEPSATQEPGQPGAPAEPTESPTDGSGTSEQQDPTESGSESSSPGGQQPSDGSSSEVPMPGAPALPGTSGQNDGAETTQPGA